MCSGFTLWMQLHLWQPLSVISLPEQRLEIECSCSQNDFSLFKKILHLKPVTAGFGDSQMVTSKRRQEGNKMIVFKLIYIFWCNPGACKEHTVVVVVLQNKSMSNTGSYPDTKHRLRYENGVWHTVQRVLIFNDTTIGQIDWWVDTHKLHPLTVGLCCVDSGTGKNSHKHGLLHIRTHM